MWWRRLSSSIVSSSTQARGNGSALTTDHRGQQRLYRAGLTGITTLLARGVTLTIGIVTLPFASQYLGKERYGLWLTLGSFIAWIAILDFGLSNSLINVLATADGRGERETPRIAVSSVFWLTSLIAGVFLLAILLAAPIVDWAGVLNVSSPQARVELRDSIVLVAVCLAIRLPSSMVGAIYQAYQEGYLYQIWAGIGGLVSAISLIVAIQLGAGLPWLVAASLGGFIFADLLGAIHHLGGSRPWLRPSWHAFRWPEASRLLRRGLQFWLAQLSAVLIFQVGLLVISRLFGAGEVAGYGTMLRLFTLVGSVQTAFVAPLWAAYGEALARQDYPWVAKTFRQSLRVSLIWSIPATLTILALMPWLFRWLVKTEVSLDWSLALAMVVMEIVNSAARCISTLLNGLGAIRLQAIYGPAAGMSNLFLAVLLGKIAGPAGVVWAIIICLVLFWLGLMGREAKYRLHTLTRELS